MGMRDGHQQRVSWDNMRQFIVIVFTGILLAAGPAYAAGLDDIIGVWNTKERDAKIEIYKCGIKYCGKIAWLKEPNYPAGSKEGTPDTPMLDHNNPDPNLRKTPLIGLPFFLTSCLQAIIRGKTEQYTTLKTARHTAAS